MRRVVFLGAARRDLDEIWSYIAEHDQTAADRLIDRIRTATRLLAERPQIGVDASALRAGLHKWPAGRYLLFYLVHPDAIQVVRVLHGARDIRFADLT